MVILQPKATASLDRYGSGLRGDPQDNLDWSQELLTTPDNWIVKMGTVIIVE